METPKAYYEQVDIDNELKLRKQLAALPPYCKQYFIGIEHETQSRTRLAYAYDLACFFDYLHENNPICKDGNKRYSHQYLGSVKTYGY